MTELDKTQPDESLAWLAESPRLRNLVLTQWQRARLDATFVSSSLATLFRTEKLGGRERRAVSECLYGMIRNYRRLEEALEAAGWRTSERAPDLERVMAYLILEHGLAPTLADEIAPGLDWAQLAGIDAKLEGLSRLEERVARRYSLPDWLASELARDFQDDAEPLARELSRRAPMTVRVNLLKATRNEVRESLGDSGITARPGRFCETALILETRVNLFSTPAFKKGHIEAQDEASQLVAEVVAPPPKGVVVDFCAGAGGKALAIAALLAGRGRVVATDLYVAKLTELRRRARRAGANNIQALTIEGEAMSSWPPPLRKFVGGADRVLVDAPCSGIGSLRRHPEARWRLDAESAGRFPALQLEILDRAAEFVRNGGRLIYATCTVLRRENEAVVERFLETHGDFEIMPVKAVWSRARAEELGDGTFLRMLPHEHGTDGFFAAVLRRVR